MEIHPPNQTTLSSCEAEIVTTDKCLTVPQSIRHCTQDLGMSDAFEQTKLYKDTQEAVDWAASCTKKAAKTLIYVNTTFASFIKITQSKFLTSLVSLKPATSSQKSSMMLHISVAITTP